MAAISILILVLLGTINVGNICLTGGQTKRMMRLLSENDGNAPPQIEPMEREGPGFLEPPMNEDLAMSARYFLGPFRYGGADRVCGRGADLLRDGRGGKRAGAGAF